MSLYEHVPHPHQPHNVNCLIEAEHAVAGFNDRLAVWITQGLGSMACAYLFALLALIGFPGWHSTPQQYVQWVSQTFIQLTALSVLAVGQSILSRHAELMAEEQYQTTIKSYHDLEQIVAHLKAQDAELLKQTMMLETMVATLGKEHEL